MLSTPTSSPSLMIAILLVGALIPAGFAPNAGSANCAAGTTFTDVEDRRLRASTPLSGTFSGSELVHVISEDYNVSTGTQGYRLNGLDAYAHDLGCETAKGVEFKVTTETPDPYPAREPQMAVQFYDGDVNYLGEVVEEDASGPLRGTLAEDARYVVVEMRDGPLISGVDYDQTPPEPYSVEFDLEFMT